jgi:hypothetical protein
LGGPETWIGKTPVDRAAALGVLKEAGPTPNLKVTAAPTLPAASVDVTETVWEPLLGSQLTVALPLLSAVLVGWATPSKL